MGGGGGGGAAVPTIGPVTANNIGILQANAAQAAADQATTMMNTAIAAMNNQFMTARNDVQPYRTQGVQALNKLNQYIGLNPYNPGVAPEAPKQLQRSDVKQYQIEDYINSHLYSRGGQQGAKDAPLAYSGVGAYNNNTATWGQGQYLIKNPNQASSDPRLQKAAGDYLYQRMLDQNQGIYDSQMKQYNQDTFEYNQNKDLYNQYLAEGPKTAEQIANEISGQPGYQAELSQGIDALQKSGAARGYLGSGRLLKEISSYGQNTLSKYYGNTLSLLAQQAGAGQAAATASAQGSMAQGQGLASLYSNLGDTLANSALASGQARANAAQLMGTKYQMIGGSDGGLGGVGSLGGIGSLASAFGG